MEKKILEKAIEFVEQVEIFNQKVKEMNQELEEYDFWKEYVAKSKLLSEEQNKLVEKQKKLSEKVAEHPIYLQHQAKIRELPKIELKKHKLEPLRDELVQLAQTIHSFMNSEEHDGEQENSTKRDSEKVS